MRPEEMPLNYLLNSLRKSGHQPGGFKSVTPVGGGSINNTFKLSTDQTVFFLKANSRLRYPKMFELERDGLDILRSSDSFRIPEVFLVDDHDDMAFLVMEFVAEGSKGKSFWPDFSAKLASLHRTAADAFGYARDNYIGRLPQSNSWSSHWTEFFIEQRLEPQLRMAGNLFSKKDFLAFEKLFHRLDALLPEESPALLHGDLWGGNYLADESGDPVLIDPAVYYGHREVDLAMMQLFGGFSQEVFEHYQREFPLEPGWKERVDLHNLYPLLVHLNLFGGSYLQSVRASLKKYL